MPPDADNPFLAIPSIASLIDLARTRGTTLSSPLLTKHLQSRVDELRQEIAAGARPSRVEIENRIVGGVTSAARPRLEPVLNATGVIIHTNLGRSPVSEEAAAAMASAAASYVSLEIEPESGVRGGRMQEIATLFRLLTGAEDAVVVNNNAAAILLALTALTAGGSVIISRGELVEIGGGFRIPDVLRQSGATLVEVGTTNRTYVRDYADAIDSRTSALLKVHPSNFRVTGFTAEASLGELAALAKERGLPLIQDLGSGALIDPALYGIAGESTIGERLLAGASVVTASGDKLLGGPQAGIIAGGGEWIRRIEAHPLARAVRADKTCLAGVAATLQHYARGDAETKIPIWRMISAKPADLYGRAQQVAHTVSSDSDAWSVVDVMSTVGGGSAPGSMLHSYAVAIRPGHGNASQFADTLRAGQPRVYSRIENETVLLDVRTVLPEDDERLIAALRIATSPHGASSS